MAEGFAVDGEVIREDRDRVMFNIHNLSGEHDMKVGYISNEALERLNGGGFADAATVFDEYRQRIASRAGAHWNANPLNEVIMLAQGDF